VDPKELKLLMSLYSKTRDEKIFALHKAKYKQTRIAEIVGCNQGTVSRVLRGEQSEDGHRYREYRERKLYPLILKALLRDAKQAGHQFFMQILANRDGEKLIPDLLGYLNGIKIVVEVKAAPARPRWFAWINKLQDYQRAKNAPYGFLISDIPGDTCEFELPDGIFVAHFDEGEKQLHWTKNNPFREAQPKKLQAVSPFSGWRID
jgi:predicted transcriptional regulator